MDAMDEEVTIASFLKVLGTGSAGTVWLVADDADGNNMDQDEEQW
jgi:hypothetical protein